MMLYQNMNISMRYSGLPEKVFHATEAMTAPTKGPIMNTQSCWSAAPPSKKAGAIERAGLTDVPVIGMQTICTNTSVSPIARPAKFPAPCCGSVAHNRRTGNSSYNLCAHVTYGFRAFHTAAEPYAQRNGRIDMATRHGTDGIGHGHDR